MKKLNPNWIYLIGSLIFFGILVLFAKDVFIPRIFNKISFDKYALLQKPNEDYTQSGLNYSAQFSTSEGNFTVELYRESAPKNVNNFVYLSEQGYYDGVYFHRMIPDLLIQGGDRNTLNDDANDDGYGKTSYYIQDEVNWESLNLSEDQINQLKSQGYTDNTDLSSKRLEKYSLAMANNGPDTNSSQFFIVLAESNDPRLNLMQGKYTVIGKVIEGENIIDKISNIPVDDSNSNNAKPLTPIKIEDIKIVTK